MNRKNPPVHNHGPAEGLGLACPESVVGGFLQGACLLAAEQTDPFSQSPHMASKYWAELVKARKRIAELEAAVTAPTDDERAVLIAAIEPLKKIEMGDDDDASDLIADAILAAGFRSPVPVERDPREFAHIECECVPAEGPSHCHLCGERVGHPISWADAHGAVPAEPSTEVSS